MQYLANFFISQAKLSPNVFSSIQLEQNYSVNNFPTTYTGKMGSGFDECYFFH